MSVVRTSLVVASVIWLVGGSTPLRADGGLDLDYGLDGRSVVGFLESDSVQLRALARSPAGERWMFGDDSAHRSLLYISRHLADGESDPTFGDAGSGQTRTALPANLITQTEAWAVEGALVQADGKPLVFGGLRPVDDETGVFPGLVCRLAVAGNLDVSFNGGCTLLRSFLGTEETCLVADVVEAADGKFVVIGNCVGPTFASRPFITRLLPDGSMDFDFAAGAGMATPLIPQALPVGQHFSALALRSDGLAVVAGHFETAAGGRADRDVGLLQFDGGGSLDAGFGNAGVWLLDESGDTDEFARDVVVREDGGVLLLAEREVADLGSGMAGEQLLLAQLLSDGTLDSSFGAGGLMLDTVGDSLGLGSRLQALALDVGGRPLVAGRRLPVTGASSSAGTEFWLAIPATVIPQADTQLLISADVATTGFVWNESLDIRLPFSVSPGQSTVVSVPLAIELDGPNDSVFDKALRVTAEAPITLNVLSGRSFATDGSLILPARQLGREYRVASWGEGGGSGSSFAVVASAADTTITVTPSVATDTRPAGVPFQVSLQQGQVYRLRALPNTDLSGSVISATRPVAVFGNHSCAIIVFGAPVQNPECGGIVEQMPPVNHWGLDFLNVPTRQRASGDVVRVYAQQNNTVVSIDGQAVAVLGGSNFYEFSRSAPSRITSSAPVSVMRYAQSCRVDFPVNPCIGDPFMLGIAPLTQWQSRHAVVLPDRDFIGTYLHTLEIIAPQAQIAEVRVDGVSVPPASFAAIGTTGYAYAHVTTSHGAHQITAQAPISVSVYGFLQHGSEGYAFPAAAAPSGGDANADDVLLRYTEHGLRDATFGSNGLVLLDHREAFGTTLPSFDNVQQLLVDGSGILVGSATQNAASGQSLMMSYRVEAGSLFRDGFESD